MGSGFAACDSGGGSTPPPTFTSVYTDYLKPGCALSASCHKGGANPVGGLDLGTSQQAAYDNLVNVAVNENADRVRVVPGSSATSYVVAKIGDPSQDGAITTQMNGIDSNDKRLPSLKAWIDGGAKND